MFTKAQGWKSDKSRSIFTLYFLQIFVCRQLRRCLLQGCFLSSSEIKILYAFIISLMSNTRLSHSIVHDLTALISFGQQIPVAPRSKAWVCSRSPAGIVGSNPAGGDGCLSLLSVVCCHAEVSATGRSLVQRSTIECGVSECDLEMSTTRRPRPKRAVEPPPKKII